MHLRVKFYKDVKNKASHIPDYWPAEVKEIHDDDKTEIPGWVNFSIEEYNEYREKRWQELKLPPLDVQIATAKAKENRRAYAFTFAFMGFVVFAYLLSRL